jgi:hypothetical protein
MSQPARVVDFPAARPEEAQRAELLELLCDGRLRVRLADGRERDCEWLETGALAPPLAAGDQVLVLPPAGRDAAVVIGRIGRYRAPQPESRLTVEATEALTLKCGESSIELRADGKLMVKGEDVLVKARGTQRIKAGTVNIN